MVGWGQDELAGTRRRWKAASQETVIGDSLYFVDEKLRTMMASANGLGPFRSSDLTVPAVDTSFTRGRGLCPADADKFPYNSLRAALLEGISPAAFGLAVLRPPRHRFQKEASGDQAGSA
jgi:hypothetical protein